MASAKEVNNALRVLAEYERENSANKEGTSIGKYTLLTQDASTHDACAMVFVGEDANEIAESLHNIFRLSQDIILNWIKNKDLKSLSGLLKKHEARVNDRS